MSTGKRLAKRSIIGTRVCAPGADGKYYSGAISAVNTPASPHQPELNGALSITPSTRYSVRFDPVAASQGRPPDSKTEYSDRDLIGPGFGSVTAAKLVSGQKVFLTYNGREIQAEIVQHREHLDEVDVVFVPPGQEGVMNLTKRIDEVRLLESRKSARLADTDTDFARLADVGSDRKRASSHSIDVPQVIGSRKRRPSSSNDSERSYNGDRFANQPGGGAGGEGPRGGNGPRESYMDECSAAMVLMSLSTPPKNPLPIHCQQHYGSWDDRVSSSSNRVVVGSPGVGGTSNSSSSSSSAASYRSGTPSPPLSDEGALSSNGLWPGSNGSSSAGSAPTHHHHHQPSQRYFPYHQRPGSSSSSPNFTYDEGIVPDLDLDRPRKKKIRCKVESDDYIGDCPSNVESGCDNDVVKPMTIYRCTWRDEENRNVRCGEVGNTWEVVAEHVLRTHLNGKKTQDNEEDFYIVDEQLEPACSPPTKSHWDMVRPRSEDPEYQKQLRLATSPAQNPQMTSTVNSQDIVIRDVFSMASVNSPNKQFKPSNRPLQAYNPNINVLTVALGKLQQHSPRRVRGDTKKCRKVYGMEHKDLWCTQCKWKKACTRFMD